MSKKKSKKNNKTNSNQTNNYVKITNRRAFHDFEILDKYVAGIVLQGTEVKSIRNAHAQLNEAFVKIDKKLEAYLYGMSISHYSHGNINNHDVNRTRKLLLNKKEIQKLKSKIERDNLTLIPLKVFLKNSKIKVEIALGKRKLKHDKRKTLKEKAINLDIKRAMKAG